GYRDNAVSSSEDFARIAGAAMPPRHKARGEPAEIALPRPFDDAVGQRRDPNNAEERGEAEEIGGVAVRQNEHVAQGAGPMQWNLIDQRMAQMMASEPAEIECG